MKGRRFLAAMVVVLALLVSAVQVAGQGGGDHRPEAPSSYAFTYQGLLRDAAGPVNVICDFRFILWDASAGGTQVGSTVVLEDVLLQGGLFTARLDFGGVHDGSARWLEVAVRCPAGSGEYVTLSPRQELTGSPSALALALPFSAQASAGGPLAWFENDGSGQAVGLSSNGGHALLVDSAGLDGVHVQGAGGVGLYVGQSGGSGLVVDSAGGSGLAVDSAASSGVYVASAGADGVKVSSAGSPSFIASDAKANGFEIGGALGDGLWVGRADAKGIRVGSAGDDGVYVGGAGNPSNYVLAPQPSGFEVAGAEGHGLFVGRADIHGVSVESAGWTGVSVGSAGTIGVYVGSAGHEGMYVVSAARDGVYVGRAGSPSSFPTSSEANGFEIAGAQGHGLFVGRADDTGVYVQSAGWNGLVVDAAGGDGVRATNTIYNALYGDTANAQGEWGLYTPDKLHAQNVTLQTLTLVAQVTGPDALSPGDVVAATGVAEPLPGSVAPLPLVRVAGPDAIGSVGVVEGRLALTPVPQPEGEEAQPRLELRSAEGPARPGDYVALTVLGVARVKVDAGQGSIEPGTRLTSGTGGRARALKTVIVEGLTLAESAPTIGIALASPDENGLVWVLVNPQ